MADSLIPLLLQSLVTLAAGGSGAAVVTGIMSHRSTKAAVSKTVAETGKTEAEIIGVGSNAAATQVDTSLKLVQWMQAEMTVMRTEVAGARTEARAAGEESAAARRELGALQLWKTAHETLMDAHMRWDEEVFVVLRDRNITIDRPPPLRTASV